MLGIISSRSTEGWHCVIVGQGGLPENPRQYLRGQTVWQDLRLPSKNLNQLKNNLSTSEYSQNPAIIEVQTWKINQRGNVELLANIPNHNLDFVARNHQCMR